MEINGGQVVDDDSSTVREAVIKLAGRTGKKEDLEWLAAKETLIGILEGVEIAQEAGERPRWVEEIKIWRASQNLW